MYAAFYKLSTEPFQVTPDPRYLYPSESHKEAFASIVYGVEQRRGFISVIGEVGTGKTTILRTYLEEVDRDKVVPIYLFNPDLTFDELVREVAAELRVLYAKASRTQMVSNIHAALVSNYKEGKNVVLIIDEAQNMPLATLESLRMLSNIETTQSKLLQVVLVGQPELGQLLDRNELRQLRQRIAVRAIIKPLTERESVEYIHSRLEQVATDDQAVFTQAAIRKIVRYAGGIPRNINVACDSTLINGYGHRKRPATAAIVDEALAPFAKTARRRRFRWGWAAAASVLLAIGAAAWLFWPRMSLMFDAFVQNGTYQSPAVESMAPVTKTAGYGAHSAAASSDASATANTAPDIPPEKPVGHTPDTLESRLSGGALEVDTPERGTARDPQPIAFVNEPEATSPQVETIAIPDVSLTERLNNPAPLPDEIFPVTRTMNPGSILSQHCLEIYGFLTNDLFAYIASENGITNFNDIEVGQTLEFPALTPQLQRSRSIYIQRKLRQADTSALFTENSG